ncbi:MAG: GerW family sporulation protein [Clostridia bacterium]|nr:GerW family sporulation protein [Clostridia bacterium]
MAEHPIQGLMTTAMQSIKDMVDVNTIVGDAVQAPDGTVIIPISKVSFGFAAGGGEYNNCCIMSEESEEDDQEDKKTGSKAGKFPFAGGSGAGVSINPVAFMVVGQNQIKLLPVNVNSSVDKILDMVPDLIEKANETIRKKIAIKKEIKTGDTVGQATIEKNNQ